MALFKRSIEVEVEEEGENIRLKGRLADLRLGEHLHWIEAEMLVSLLEGEIKQVEGHMQEIPLEECRQGLLALDRLKGVRIKPGFTELVRNTVGSSIGCSHLASLVINMGNVSVQGRGAFIRKHFPDDETSIYALEETARELGLVDSCVCWKEDGPIMRIFKQDGEDEGEGGNS